MGLIDEAELTVDANELRLIKGQVETNLNQLAGAKSRGQTLLVKVNTDARYSAADKTEVQTVLGDLKTHIIDFIEATF